MAISLKHNFTSAVADEGDTSLVRPSNWNAEHDLTLATSRLIGRTTAGTGAAEEISVGTGLSLSAGSLAVSSTTPQVNSTNTFTANQIISVTDNTNAALRITQLGTGEALRVEDSTNPDATPFVVNASGNVGINGSTTGAELTIGGTQQNRLWFDAFGVTNRQLFVRSNGTASSKTTVASGDSVGSANFFGYDGTANIELANITATVDGTPGTNDMPGRLTFSTTADGASSPTERLRISSDGTTTITGTGIINASSSNTALRVTQTGSGNALVVEDSSNPDSSPVVVNAEGRVGIGEDVPVLNLHVAALNASTQTQMGVTSADYASDFKSVYMAYSGASTTGTTYGITNAELGSLRFQNVNNALIGTNGATPLILATNSLERFRVGTDGQLGIGGANYGTSGQSIISGGSGAAPAWGDVARPGVSNTFTANQIISVTDNTNAALRITQTGTGNALLVEDSSNPDSSPFVVNADGQLLIGNTTAQTGINAGSGGVIQVIGPGGADQSISVFAEVDLATTSGSIRQHRKRTTGAVQSGDRFGIQQFAGFSGTNYRTGASIYAEQDGGTISDTSMAGRLIFATTPDGSTSVSERFRIGSSGQLGIGGANYGTSGQVLTSNGSGAAPSWTTVSGGGGVDRGQIEQLRLGAFT